MVLSWDDSKRLKILVERGLDIAQAQQIFDGAHLDKIDSRFEYGEVRIVTFGFLDERLCVLVWTERDNKRRLISLRKANEREQEKFKARMGGS